MNVDEFQKIADSLKFHVKRADEYINHSMKGKWFFVKDHHDEKLRDRIILIDSVMINVGYGGSLIIAGKVLTKKSTMDNPDFLADIYYFKSHQLEIIDTTKQT